MDRVFNKNIHSIEQYANVENKQSNLFKGTNTIQQVIDVRLTRQSYI